MRLLELISVMDLFKTEDVNLCNSVAENRAQHPVGCVHIECDNCPLTHKRSYHDGAHIVRDLTGNYYP